MVHLLVQALHPPDGRILCAGDHGILSEGYKMVTKSLSQGRLLNLTIAEPEDSMEDSASQHTVGDNWTILMMPCDPAVRRIRFSCHNLRFPVY
jgi:hypothetical protein